MSGTCKNLPLRSRSADEHAAASQLTSSSATSSPACSRRRRNRSSACWTRPGAPLLFNDACERATGFSRDEVVGRDLTDTLIPREESDAFREVLAFIWSSGDASPQVGHWRTKDGGLRLIAWSNRLVTATATAPALPRRERYRPDRRGRSPARAGSRTTRRSKLVEVEPAGPGAACAAAGGDARRLGGEPGARVHGRVDGVRARARGERVVRLALRGRRHRHRGRGLQPRRDRPVPARHSPVRRADRR